MKIPSIMVPSTGYKQIKVTVTIIQHLFFTDLVLSSDDDNDQVEGGCSAVMENRIGSFISGQPAESSSDFTDDDGSDDVDAFSQDDSI
ncbi:hypothetical protein DPMN_111691 [Dreissena polymorpha]|uniref:Uncharacterized protein n=1 Tax=Dreissena polymorpha TaxID=45954 RepID=A0A9D4KED3_DREPO|nr:hypothetical protein DPMN_111691 [Dreissena polymorpha]